MRKISTVIVAFSEQLFSLFRTDDSSQNGRENCFDVSFLMCSSFTLILYESRYEKKVTENNPLEKRIVNVNILKKGSAYQFFCRMTIH